MGKARVMTPETPSHARQQTAAKPSDLGAIPMKHPLLAAILFLSLLGFAAMAGDADVPKLSGAQCMGVIAEANKAVSAYLHIAVSERDGDNIPKRHLGATILSLKPLRVAFDRVNVKMIFVENDQSEAGLYVYIPISSHLPDPKDFAELVKLAEDETLAGGTLYRYRISRKGVPRSSK